MATTLADISIKDNSSWHTYLNLIYPVGSIYIAYTSTSPATRFGGTWSQISGRFLYCTTNTGTGGHNDITLTIDQIPSHAHTLDMAWMGNGGQNITRGKFVYRDSGTTTAQPVWNSSYVGGSKSHSNMPAYQGVYCWRRTA